MSLVPFPGANTGRLPKQPPRTGPVLPYAPQTPDDTGLPQTFLIELLGKVMFQLGLTRLTELSQHLGLSGAVVESLCHFMRREGLVEVARRGQHDADVHFDLTMGGRARASEWLARSQYVGPAPVTLDDYIERVQLQSATHRQFKADEVRAAFADMVLPDGVLDHVGVAMNSGRPLLLFGQPGSGKTYLAEQLHRLLSDPVAIPHAVLVQGEVIRIFDEHWHEPLPTHARHNTMLDNRARPDARWVTCRRPVVVSGGELTISMLDLSFDARSGFYEAPPHVKANNGLYIVDDLGRQMVRPHELMNRWIVPMDRRRDYLMLRNGGKFQVPFDMWLAFSTNLKPSSLADGAFLRRLGHKIEVGALSEAGYRKVFEDECAAQGVAFDGKACEDLIQVHHRRDERPCLACFPRDLVHLVATRAAYLDKPAVLTSDALDWAWEAYFATRTG